IFEQQRVARGEPALEVGQRHRPAIPPHRQPIGARHILSQAIIHGKCDPGVQGLDDIYLVEDARQGMVSQGRPTNAIEWTGVLEPWGFKTFYVYVRIKSGTPGGTAIVNTATLEDDSVGGSASATTIVKTLPPYRGHRADVDAGDQCRSEGRVEKIQGRVPGRHRRGGRGFRPPLPGRPQEDPKFAAALADVLGRYGHRGHYETYLRNPRWSEAPDLLLEQLPALGQVDAAALRERQQAAAETAWQRIRREVPFWAQPLIRAQVKAANRDSNRREAARNALIALLATGRRLWLLIGERLVGEGAVDRPEEVFHLMPSEVERYAHGLLPRDGLRARVASRSELFAVWQASTPAEWFCLGAEGRPYGGEMPRSTVETGKKSADGVWRGVATGTGVARGKVRRLRHPAEGLALQTGEILVAPSTDPGWTPLFLKAAGLVVETGGYMSHGAIVAREFALPAVVNLPGILDALRDGEEIVVDGLRGEVVRVRSETVAR
ncbi:MAG: hypothetical protein HGA75_18095, partial [Thiobacillus sp.]|nr:hypothetical protein [Thiobacillus sp.]